MECADAAHGLRGHIISVSVQSRHPLHCVVLYAAYIVYHQGFNLDMDSSLRRMEAVLVQGMWLRHLVNNYVG